MAIHQLVHTLSYGDAISTEVVALQRTFLSLGVDSEIFAINVHPHYKKSGALAGKVRDYRELAQDFSGTVLLHYSLGSPLNNLYRELSKANRQLIYHNLTPAAFFQNINPRVMADIEAGARELPELCRISDRILADSDFNAGEIRALGFEATELPLLVEPSRWDESANPGIVNILRSQPGPHILHVGRIAPNKCIDDIIRVFYFLRNFGEKTAQLWLVGVDTDTELYSFALKRMVHEWGLAEQVHFVGCMADTEVRALYENASLYLCLSEHEGFCLPIIEAMHFGLPVVAYQAGAVIETVGDGGVLVSEKSPPVLAELCAELVRNKELRAKIISAGHRRVAHFSAERFSSNVKNLFLTNTSAQHVHSRT